MAATVVILLIRQLSSAARICRHSDTCTARRLSTWALLKSGEWRCRPFVICRLTRLKRVRGPSLTPQSVAYP